MAETSVLYASAIEVFAVVAGECKCSLGIVDGDGCGLPHHLAAILCDVQETGGAVNADIHGGSAHDVFCIGGLQLQAESCATWILYEYFSFGFSLRGADDATVVVLEEADDVLTVKIEGVHLSVVEIHLHSIVVAGRKAYGLGLWSRGDGGHACSACCRRCRGSKGRAGNEGTEHECRQVCLMHYPNKNVCFYVWLLLL